jgi:hypothetical protein
LAEESKAYLRSFKQLHPEIYILFKEWHEWLIGNS